MEETGNSFENLANGIISDETTLSVVNNNFGNIQEKPYYNSGNFISGYGVYHKTNKAHVLYVGGEIDGDKIPSSVNIFKSVNRAIQSNGILEAHNTGMENVNYGIALKAQVGSQIWSTNNIMSVNRRGYNLSAVNSDASGKIKGNRPVL